ncbi:putative RNA 3'-terminal phosphate cyclase [Aspergillus granulosus]|uniref:RNA 3'-terminal phosphate cyclase n=1 Tax=Aspergillus granulosus TaxID=176169 RepID=A0ABR4HAX6_9EURO
MAPAAPTEPIRLDGRKLEGGGQLVRIAVALSALTGKPIAVEHIRGNRSGKQGLKASHLAAVKTLGELSGSTLVKAQIGSCSLGFYPPSHDQDQGRRTDTEINIRLPTPGSVFLVFQALYPYLLHSSTKDQIRLNIIGGTNVSSSPSYDYVSQVLIPNFARVGLPPLSVGLEKRGWASGHGQVQMGEVVFLIDPLLRRASGGTPSADFPSIDLHRHQRGKISQIDITILAPDDHLVEDARDLPRGFRHDDHTAESDELGDDRVATVRDYLERQVHKVLRKRLKELPASYFSPELCPETRTSGPVPVLTHTTESTHSRSCMYVLIVAHMSNGFKIGRDALYGSLKELPKQQPKTKKRQGKSKPREDMDSRVNGLVSECVENFIRELYDPALQTAISAPGSARHQPCVDEYMRDQLVVFETLGKRSGTQTPQDGQSYEDERYWSLHTQTAQWVCRQILGEDS